MKALSRNHLICLLLLPLAGRLHADTITIFNTGSSNLQSTTIREKEANPLGPDYEQYDSLIIGQTTDAGDYIRALFTFDLSDPLLTGATINSVTFTLTADKKDDSSTAGAVNLELFELTTAYDYLHADWDAATASTNWSTPGGDFPSPALATTLVDPSVVDTHDEISFTGSGLNSSVQSSLGGNIYFLAKLSVEDDVLRKIFFLEREGVSQRPTLTVDYTVIPEPSTFTLIALVSSLYIIAFRRRR